METVKIRKPTLRNEQRQPPWGRQTSATVRDINISPIQKFFVALNKLNCDKIICTNDITIQF